MLTLLKWSVFVIGRFDSEGFFSRMDPEDLILRLSYDICLGGSYNEY